MTILKIVTKPLTRENCNFVFKYSANEFVKFRFHLLRFTLYNFLVIFKDEPLKVRIFFLPIQMLCQKIGRELRQISKSFLLGYIQVAKSSKHQFQIPFKVKQFIKCLCADILWSKETLTRIVRVLTKRNLKCVISATVQYRP